MDEMQDMSEPTHSQTQSKHNRRGLNLSLQDRARGGKNSAKQQRRDSSGRFAGAVKRVERERASAGSGSHSSSHSHAGNGHSRASGGNGNGQGQRERERNDQRDQREQRAAAAAENDSEARRARFDPESMSRRRGEHAVHQG